MDCALISLVNRITLKVTACSLELKLHKPFDSKSQKTGNGLNGQGTLLAN
jgi:hypothetical protein